MANKVDVFTEELSKVFTILQQQYVMIKYMKALITSGELDETEINKLKEQVNSINDEVTTIQNTIEEMNKVIATDIGMTNDGSLILEHDGVEITGQKKQVAVYTKEQINALLNNAGLKTFKLKNTDDYTYNTNGGNQSIIVTTTDISIYNDACEYVYNNGPCILQFDYLNRDTSYSSPVRILLLYCKNGGYGHYVAYGTTGDEIVNCDCTRNTSATSEENEFNISEVAIRTQIKNTYRHDLILNNVIHISFYSSDSLNVDSVQDLTTIVKPTNNSSQYICCTYDSEVGLLYAVLIYQDNIWKYIVQGSSAFVNVTTLKDTIKTI